jgi:subtilisin-like proprotein convertase family protein
MKSRSLKIIMALSLAGTLGVDGALYDSGFANSGYVPDGNLTGWSDTRTISGLASPITDVSVRLEFSGGYNGDLYAYLTHGGVLVPLLNRVGAGTGNETSSTWHFGFSTAGMNVFLSDAGSMNIHDVANPAALGVYQPDGRVASPLSGGGTIGTSERVGFSAFNGMDPNGTWTLFFADTSGGGGRTRIEAWDLQITAVPEPVNVALGIFGGAACIWTVWRRLKKGNSEPAP